MISPKFRLPSNHIRCAVSSTTHSPAVTEVTTGMPVIDVVVVRLSVYVDAVRGSDRYDCTVPVIGVSAVKAYDAATAGRVGYAVAASCSMMMYVVPLIVVYRPFLYFSVPS